MRLAGPGGPAAGLPGLQGSLGMPRGGYRLAYSL